MNAAPAGVLCAAIGAGLGITRGGFGSTGAAQFGSRGNNARIAANPRANWQQKVEENGLTWHTGEQPYWNESAFYEFSAKEVDVLEAATNELEAMTLPAAQHVIDNRLYSRMGNSGDRRSPLIESSWEAEPPSLYGRFDLAYDGPNPPKLLEYNADTPTSLLEAAVVQWYWLQDVLPEARPVQFPARAADRPVEGTDAVPAGQPHRFLLHGRCRGRYDRDLSAGHGAAGGPDVVDLPDRRDRVERRERSSGPDDRPLGAVFKLYPWEWMVREEFGKHLSAAPTVWIEPAWKMLLSNKGMLPVLWKLLSAASLSAGGAASTVPGL